MTVTFINKSVKREIVQVTSIEDGPSVSNVGQPILAAAAFLGGWTRRKAGPRAVILNDAVPPAHRARKQLFGSTSLRLLRMVTCEAASVCARNRHEGLVATSIEIAIHPHVLECDEHSGRALHADHIPSGDSAGMP
jgi:hypothetical protein